MMLWLDNSSSVIWWSSEELVIWYKSPVDNKPHRYFPDFLVHFKNKDGNERTTVVELKPLSQFNEPKKPQRITEAYVKKVQEYGKNTAKWASARSYCLMKGYEFKVLTEKDLGV
jgi:putative hemolysin